MKVSIIITSYNRPSMLGWTIQSVIRQTYPNIETIIVDASTEEEAKHIARTCTFTNSHSWGAIDCCFNFKILKMKNTGVSDARNSGAAVSTGEALIFLDDDNWIEPTYVEKTVALMTEGVGIASTDTHIFSEKSDSVVKSEIETVNTLKDRNNIHSSSLVRREAYNQANGYKNDVYEDWELWLNILKHGWKMKTVNEPLLHYRHAEPSLITRHKERHDERIRNMKAIHSDIYS